MSDLKQQIRSISAEQAGVLYERLQSLAALRESVDEIPILPRQSPLPLSLGQERLWLFDQMYPNTASYNISTVIPVQAGYARELAESWRELLERHEILRTHYPIVQGEVRQLATSAADFELATTDLRKLDETERLTAAQSAASREARTPFDLLRGPVCRARLLHLDEQLDWLLITVHHIATDGWSQQILQRELQQIFSAKVSSHELTLPPLPIQYADFASYQRASSSSAAAREAGNYWRRQLAEAPPVFSLPADCERPPVQTFVGATQRFRLSSQTSLRLREVARDSGHTTFTVLYAALAAMIARHTGRDDIVLGTAVAGRGHPDTEGLVGFFVNTVVLRLQLADDVSFHEILKRAKSNVAEAMSYQEYPFDQIVRDLRVQRHPSRNPLFQIIFTLESFSGDNSRGQNQGENQSADEARQPSQLPDLKHPAYVLGAAKFELTFGFVEDAAGIGGSVEYNTDLYDHETVAAVIHRLATLLDAVAVDPATRIGRMPLLLGSERAFIAEGCQQIPQPVWDRVHDVVTAKNWQRGETGVAVLDRFGHPPPPGVEGELCAGPAYHLVDAIRFGEPALSDVIRTGWRARYRRHGQLELLGPSDRVVSWRGLSIDLDRIAAQTAEAGVDKMAVLPLHESSEFAVALFCFLEDEDAYPAKKLAAQIRQWFPDVCDAIRLVPVANEAALPHAELSIRELERIEQAPPSLPEPVSDPITAAIMGIWIDVLEAPEVGLQDNFFDLGGNSLAAVRVLGRVKQSFQVDLDLFEVFEGGVATIAEVVRKSLSSRPQTPPVPEIDSANLLDPGPPPTAADAAPLPSAPASGSVEAMSDAEVEQQLRRLLADSQEPAAAGPETPAGLTAAGLDPLSDHEVEAMLAQLLVADAGER